MSSNPPQGGVIYRGAQNELYVLPQLANTLCPNSAEKTQFFPLHFTYILFERFTRKHWRMFVLFFLHAHIAFPKNTIIQFILSGLSVLHKNWLSYKGNLTMYVYLKLMRARRYGLNCSSKWVFHRHLIPCCSRFCHQLVLLSMVQCSMA